MANKTRWAKNQWLSKLEDYAKENNIIRPRLWLKENLGVSDTAINKWANGSVRPRMDKTAKIIQMTDYKVKFEDVYPEMRQVKNDSAKFKKFGE